MRSRGTTILAAISAAAAMLFLTTMLRPIAVRAQQARPPSAIAPPKLPANEREVYLVRQDQSDCENSTVPSGDSPNVSGTLLLTRGNDGNTTVQLAMTVSPNTTYHFYLKCVRELGQITTGDEGTGFATFVFPTNTTGSTYAFDMYPDGAPAGNKFQSATVSY